MQSYESHYDSYIEQSNNLQTCLITLQSILPSTLSPQQSLTCFCAYSFKFARMVQKVNHMVCKVLNVVPLTQPRNLRFIQTSRHELYCFVSGFIPFWCWVILHWMDIPLFLYSFPSSLVSSSWRLLIKLL